MLPAHNLNLDLWQRFTALNHLRLKRESIKNKLTSLFPNMAQEYLIPTLKLDLRSETPVNSKAKSLSNQYSELQNELAQSADHLKNYLAQLSPEQWAQVDLDTKPSEWDEDELYEEMDFEISLLSHLITFADSNHFDFLKIVFEKMSKAQWAKLNLFYSGKHNDSDLFWEIAIRIYESSHKDVGNEDAKSVLDTVMRHLSLEQWATLSEQSIIAFDIGYAYIYEGTLRQTRWDNMRDFCCALAVVQKANSQVIHPAFDNLIALAKKAEKDAHPEAYLMLQDFLNEQGEKELSQKVQVAIDDYHSTLPARLSFAREMAVAILHKERVLDELDALRVPAAAFTPAKDAILARELGAKDKENQTTPQDAKKRKVLRESI